MRSGALLSPASAASRGVAVFSAQGPLHGHQPGNLSPDAHPQHLSGGLPPGSPDQPGPYRKLRAEQMPALKGVMTEAQTQGPAVARGHLPSFGSTPGSVVPVRARKRRDNVASALEARAPGEQPWLQIEGIMLGVGGHPGGSRQGRRPRARPGDAPWQREPHGQGQPHLWRHPADTARPPGATTSPECFLGQGRASALRSEVVNLGRHLTEETVHPGLEAVRVPTTVLKPGDGVRNRTQALPSLRAEDPCLAREARRPAWGRRESEEEPGLGARTLDFVFSRQFY